MKDIDAIQTGLAVDNPQLTVKWDSSQEQVLEQLKNCSYKLVSSSYICFDATVFDSSIRCMIGLHFSFSNSKSALTKIELFRDSISIQDENSIIESFLEYQTVLEKKFGKATLSRPSAYLIKTDHANIIKNYTWNIGRIRIYHFVIDRFGLEEHLSISVGSNNDEIYFYR